MVVSGPSMITGPSIIPLTASRLSTGVSTAPWRPKCTWRVPAPPPPSSGAVALRSRKSSGAVARAWAWSRSATASTASVGV